MKKSFIYISLVVAGALFNGCGGSSTPVDNIAPSLTSDKYVYENVLEGTDVRVTLISDDLEADFFETSSLANIQGSTLTFTAPSFVVGGANSYSVKVTAKDEAGNESPPKEFTFTVSENNTETYEANRSIVAPVGDKTFTSEGAYLVGPTGLLWVDEVSDLMTYNDAETYCTNRGTDFRVASRTELLNTINYELDGTESVSLLDEDFSISRAGNVASSWASSENGKYYIVNNFSGVDANVSATDLHRVRCVKGTSAGRHTFRESGTNFIDNDTGLEWRVIDVTQAKFVDFVCPDGFNIPTINQLRSIYDYDTGRLNSDIAPMDSGTIWSSTEWTNKVGTKAYYIMLNEKTTSIRTDEYNLTAYGACVKQ